MKTSVLRSIQKLVWHYPEHDLGAIREIEERIAAAARGATPITYSDLVRGVRLRLQNVDGGKPFELGVPEWSDLHRAILGEFLGYIACRSYERGGFLASAIAISKGGSAPSSGFRELAVQIGLLGARSDVDVFWLEQLALTKAWYAENRSAL